MCDDIYGLQKQYCVCSYEQAKKPGIEEQYIMLNLIKNFFSKPTKASETEDVLKIALEIDPLLNTVVAEIFQGYWETLNKEPTTYIVPAVWGAQKGGDIDAVQKEIHRKVNPVVEAVLQSLGLKKMSSAQAFALRFLVNGFIISKITNMVELLKSKDKLSVMQQHEPLRNLDPLGTA